NVIAVDCEWHGETAYRSNAYLRSIQFSHKKGHAYCVILHGDMEREDPDNWLTAKDDKVPDVCFEGGHELARRELRRLCFGRHDGQKVRVVGHNFKADLARLIPWGLDLTELFEAPLDVPGVGTDPDAMEGWVKTALEGGFDTMLAL